MRICPRSMTTWTLYCVGLSLCLPGFLKAEVHSFHHENVLGTSLEIQIEADSSPAATAAESRIIQEISRLSRIFSGYDPTSEFSVWQKEPGTSTALSPELFRVLQSSDRWRELTQGAFNPAVQDMTQLWRQAEERNFAPTSDELAHSVKRVSQEHWRLDANKQTALRTSSVPLSLNAIAKGAIVDSACQVTMSSGDIHGLMVNMGGDLRVCGESVKQIHIADPKQDAVNGNPISTIYLNNQAVATSGPYRRGFRVAGKWYSHILDPRTGQPAQQIVSATVVAPISADADALATSLNVLPIESALALVESTPDAHCLILTAEGQQMRSRDWNELEQPGLFRFAATAPREVALVQPQGKSSKEKALPGKAAEADKEPAPLELLVKFELNKPAQGQYRRPYVAIWLEDKDEFPVRTALLWMQTKQPGPRWHRDLLRWYRNEGVRKLVDDKDLIATISSATRNAGEYKAVFDGKDDDGKILPAGQYTLLIEVAREHGTYQLIRHKVTLGEQPIAETKLKGNVEIKAASIEYRPRPTEPAKPAPPAAK